MTAGHGGRRQSEGCLRRIVSGWAVQLGSAQAVCRRWIAIHVEVACTSGSVHVEAGVARSTKHLTMVCVPSTKRSIVTLKASVKGGAWKVGTSALPSESWTTADSPPPTTHATPTCGEGGEGGGEGGGDDTALELGLSLVSGYGLGLVRLLVGIVFGDLRR